MIRFYLKKKPDLNLESIKDLKSICRKFTALIIQRECKSLKEVSFIFCSDKYIRKVNKQFLGHDYETDIITFHDSDESGNIESDIIISVETVAFNAERYKTEQFNELLRVMIHGILHLCGYDDKKADDRKIMKRKELFYLKKAIACRKK
ncbi:rRNA maturation RNase YbeY [soil metagenome]